MQYHLVVFLITSQMTLLQYENKTPMGRMAQVEDLISTMLYLISDEQNTQTDKIFQLMVDLRRGDGK